MTKPPKLIHNIAAQSVIFAANYLLPLLTIPYVTRVLGVEAWGQVAFVQIVLGYFNLLTNWGLGLSATRKVAAVRNDTSRLSEVFFAVWTAQWCLAATASASLLMLVAFFPLFQKNSALYLYGVGLIISGALFPVWFLNGMERMKPAAAFQITARIAAVLSIFLLINGPDDAPLMIAINASATLLSGILTLRWIKSNISLHWRRPAWHQIWREIQEGTALSGSNIWIGLYTTITPMILGMIAGPAAVGYYMLADRVRQAAEAALSPIAQALFPRMSHLFAHNTAEAKRLLKWGGLSIAALASTISLVLWFFSEPIVLLLGGQSFMPASIVLKWLAPLPFVLALTNLFGMQIMLPNHHNRAFNFILTTAGIVGICTVFPMVLWQGMQGAAINTFLTECLITITMGVYLFKKGFFTADTKRCDC